MLAEDRTSLKRVHSAAACVTLTSDLVVRSSLPVTKRSRPTAPVRGGRRSLNTTAVSSGRATAALDDHRDPATRTCCCCCCPRAACCPVVLRRKLLKTWHKTRDCQTRVSRARVTVSTGPAVPPSPAFCAIPLLRPLTPTAASFSDSVVVSRHLSLVACSLFDAGRRYQGLRVTAAVVPVPEVHGVERRCSVPRPRRRRVGV